MDLDQYRAKYTYDVGVGYDGVLNNRFDGEVELVNIMVMFGNPIALIFFYYMLKFTPSFRVFILLTLFHFAPILNPLFIYFPTRRLHRSLWQQQYPYFHLFIYSHARQLARPFA